MFWVFTNKRFKSLSASYLFTLATILSGLTLAACGQETATPQPPISTTVAPIITAAAVQTVGSVPSAPSSATLVVTATVAVVSASAATLPARITTQAAAPTSPLATTAGQTGLTTTPAIITRASGDKLAMTFELARSPQEQSTGLMGRSGLPEDTGMLFIFQQPGLGGFWMKNTPLPLSIAFIDPKGKIVDIQDMQPFSEEVHAPTREYLWALEVPQGYFARKGVKPGDAVTLGGSK